MRKPKLGSAPKTPLVDKTTIGSKLFVVCYVNTQEGHLYQRYIWAESREECLGKLLGIDKPPEDMKHILTTEVTILDAKEIIKRQRDEDPLLAKVKEVIEDSEK